MPDSASKPPVLVLMAAALLPMAPCPAQDTESGDRAIDFQDALRQYKKLMRHKSPAQRLKGREILARTRDPRALQILSKSYEKPEAPRAQVRYLLADLATRHFAAEEHYAALSEWRAEFKDPTDSWLWFKTMEPLFMGAHMDEMLRAGQERGDIFVRAASLQAMCRMIDGGLDQRPPVAASISKILSRLPKDPLEKGLLLEACAALLHGQRRVIQKRSGPWKPIARTLIESLGDRRLPTRSKQVLARYFAPTFQLPNLGTTPDPWLQWLDGKPVSKHSPPPPNVRFFGLPAVGQRICYVVDASNSMLEPVSMQARERLDLAIQNQKGGSDPIPWDTIHTRFDLVREFLSRSLRTLNKNTKVCVILFGDTATPTNSAPKLVSANRTNVGKILEELAAMARHRKPHQPNPTLLGATNLHAGILRALQTTHSRPILRDAYVHRKLFSNGCDTIYLVSDGEPDRDNVSTSGEHIYGRPPHDYLVEDLRRVNLFRKVQIHCVGLGSATPNLLARIADSGFGSLMNTVRAK